MIIFQRAQRLKGNLAMPSVLVMFSMVAKSSLNFHFPMPIARPTFTNTVNVNTGINYFPNLEFTSCIDNASVLNYSNYCGFGPDYGQVQSFRVIMENLSAPGEPEPI